MPLTDRSLYVLGKKIGTTNVSVYDAAKQLVGVIDVEVELQHDRLAATVERLGAGCRARRFRQRPHGPFRIGAGRGRRGERRRSCKAVRARGHRTTSRCAARNR